MKTFLTAVILAAICFYSIQANAQQRVSSSRPGDAPRIRAGEKYYVIFMAHQDSENTIPMSHTFAVFLRTTGEGANRTIVETATINWLPEAGHVALTRPAEPGVNKTLAQTLAWAKERNLEVTMRGPYEIDADFYRQAVAQVARLENGRFQYRCYAARSRNTAKNCIYAVADLFDDETPLDTGSSRGLEATMKVVEYFKPRFKSKELASAEFAPLLADLKLYDLRNPGSEVLAGE